MSSFMNAGIYLTRVYLKGNIFKLLVLSYALRDCLWSLTQLANTLRLSGQLYSFFFSYKICLKGVVIYYSVHVVETVFCYDMLKT